MNPADNLKPFVKGDPRIQQYKEKAAATRKANRAKRANMKETLNTILTIALKKGNVVMPDDVMSLAEAKNLNITAQDAIAISMVDRAIKGDVQAAIFVRDTVGDKPSDKVQLNQEVTVESWAKNHKPKL